MGIGDKEQKTVNMERAEGLDTAFQWFNVWLFEDSLPKCAIELRGKAGVNGYFKPDALERVNDGAIVHEIGINPDILDDQKIALAALVRQMVSLWQHEYGMKKPAQYNYCNQEWIEKMTEIGLPPATDKPGYGLEHSIVEDGEFNKALKESTVKKAFPWKYRPREGSEERASKNKVKYVCPKCNTIIWTGRTGRRIRCDDCNVRYEEQRGK